MRLTRKFKLPPFQFVIKKKQEERILSFARPRGGGGLGSPDAKN